MPGSRLLDVGCGAGAFAEAAQPSYQEVRGIDISSEAVLLARQRGVDAHEADIGTGRLPFGDGTFDTVVALSVLQYVVDLPGALAECRRVLRPGGQCILCVPNMRTAWRVSTLLLKGRFPRTSCDPVGVDGGTVHYFTSKTIRDLVVRAGFEVAGVFGVFCIPQWLETQFDSGVTGWFKRELCCAETLLNLRAASTRAAT